MNGYEIDLSILKDEHGESKIIDIWLFIYDLLIAIN